jgi:tRNA(fMet)-specific endonuclease VapC
MNYLLDTSVCIDYLRRPGSPMHTWLDAVDADTVHLCSVVQAELLLGARKNPTEKNRRNVSRFLGFFDGYPFDYAAAEIHADIRAELERKGQGIGPHDTQIAAIALVHGATLVTGNPKEFGRVPGLKLLSLAELAGKIPS